MIPSRRLPYYLRTLTPSQSRSVVLLWRCCGSRSVQTAAAVVPPADKDSPSRTTAATGSSSTSPSSSSSSKTRSKRSSPVSSSSSSPSSSSSSSSKSLPTRHSRHKLPLICTDPYQLNELTQQILEAPLSSLYTYRDNSTNNDAILPSLSRTLAWDQANPVIQKVEFVLRGHAHTIPNTQWNRWLPSLNNNNNNCKTRKQQLPELGTTTSTTSTEQQEEDVQPTVRVMEQLIDRLWEEGFAYMTVRASRLEELYGPKEEQEADNAIQQQSQELVSGTSNSTTSKPLTRLGSGNKSLVDSDEDDDLAQLLIMDGAEQILNQGNNDEDDDESKPSYLNDFALPGPTTHMYDILLDSMACYPINAQTGYLLLQDVLGRHQLDGGDINNNHDEYTRPTVLSYNAPIRLASNLPYSDTNNPSPQDAMLRDEALQLALGAFDALSQSSILSRNCATYGYLLHAIAKFIPPSRTRGNIAQGMWYHARQQGLLDEMVVQAFQTAHTPSNGLDFDEWLERHGLLPRQSDDNSKNNQYYYSSPYLRSVVLGLPPKWRRNSRVLRHHPREATY